jgi:hypothetical protein
MRYIVDRFEGEYAVCETEQGEYVNIKRSMLPQCTAEGDILIWNGKEYVLDAEATQVQKEKIKKLSKDLWI